LKQQVARQAIPVFTKCEADYWKLEFVHPLFSVVCVTAFLEEKTTRMVQEVHHEEGKIAEGGLQRRHSDGIERLPHQITRMTSVSHYMDVDDIDAKIDYYANEDKSSTKTWTRVIVEKYLQNVSFISL
jgi:hypothetical protein